DSTQFVSLARVIKGRALLDLGQYTAADTTVQPVLTSFVYTTDPSVSSATAPFTLFWNGAVAAGDQEGVNGLPFVSAHDPRVLTVYMQQAQVDTTDSLFAQNKYPTQDT